MALNRNFRTTYYKTLGVPVVQHIVDVEASYAALLAEPVVNRVQVVKLAQEIGIPAHYRDLVWQLLAGALPPHTAIWDFAIQERTLMYQDVVGAARVLRPALGTAASDGCFGDDADDADGFDGESGPAAALGMSTAESVDAADAAAAHQSSLSQPSKTTAVSKKDRASLIQLHRTYWSEIMARKSLRGMDDGLYLHRVAGVVCEVVAGEMERFWCFAKLLELFHDGMGQFKPVVSLQSIHEARSVSDFEVLFIRILEALKKDKDS